MRTPLVLLAVLAAAGSVARAQAPAPKLLFDSTRVDTATCDGLLIQFLDFRGDPIGGNGFVIRVMNRNPTPRDFDPTHFRVQLKSGRTVTALIGPDIASAYLQGSGGGGMDQSERMRMQLDITNDLKWRSGRVAANAAVDRFLALGWTRAVSGDPAELLPLTVYCGRVSLGRIGPAAAAHH